MVQVLRPSDVAERWQCSERHVRNLVHSGMLPSFRIGDKLIRISLDAVEAFEKCSLNSRAVFCRGWDYSTWCENGAGRRQALRAKHCEDAVTRWQNFTGQTATLEATGEAFESKGVPA